MQLLRYRHGKTFTQKEIANSSFSSIGIGQHQPGEYKISFTVNSAKESVEDEYNIQYSIGLTTEEAIKLYDYIGKHIVETADGKRRLSMMDYNGKLVDV